MSLFLLYMNMLSICARINCRLIYSWYAKQVPQFAEGMYAEDALLIPWQSSWGIKNVSQSEPPAPKPDTSPSRASLLCNEVYSWSFLKIVMIFTRLQPGGTVKFWHRSLTFCCIQFAILPYHSLLPCPFIASLPQQQICCFLSKWTRASQPCLLVTKRGHPLSISAREHLGLWKVCERWATLWTQENSLQKNPKAYKWSDRY